MLAFMAIVSVAAPQVPPAIDSPPFECTPIWFDPASAQIGCADGVAIGLWGISFRRDLTGVSLEDVLQSSVKAEAVHIGTDGRIYLSSAPAMRCFSRDHGQLREAECFVKSDYVFGPEDLACKLVRATIAKPKAFATDHFSICLGKAPRIERGG